MSTPPRVGGSTQIKTTSSNSGSAESSNALKKKLQFLSKEYVKQRKELERISQIALQQHEDIEQQNHVILVLSEQCRRQQTLIHDLDNSVNVERELCEDAIRLSKRLQSTAPPTLNEDGENEQTKMLLEQKEDELLDDSLNSDVKKRSATSSREHKDPIYLVVEDDNNDELETVQELREENGLLRMELFAEREEKHRLEYEKKHLLDLVHHLTSQLNLA
jgi:hypothetical protein